MIATELLTTENSVPQSLVLSVLFHIALLALLLSIAPKRLKDMPLENGIEVDFIAIDAFKTANPDEAIATPDKSAPIPSKVVKDQMVRPGRMLSAGLLAHRDNAAGRRDFAGLAADEQKEQLCALEALEQIRAWDPSYHPLRMVSYTFAELRYSGNRIIADGAVFWSHDNWHRLRFDCTLSNDQSQVLSFAFRVGVIVPKDQWEAYNLTKYK